MDVFGGYFKGSTSPLNERIVAIKVQKYTKNFMETIELETQISAGYFPGEEKEKEQNYL